MTAHVLEVTAGSDGRRTYTAHCPELTAGCGSWIECRHDDCDTDRLDRLEEEGDDEPVLHGVAHSNHLSGFGWSVRTNECFIANYPDLAEAARDLWGFGQAPLGRHVVVAAWEPYDDADMLTLKLVEPAEAAR